VYFVCNKVYYLKKILCKAVLTTESVDEIPKCNYLNESWLTSTFLWCCLLCGSRWFNFCVCGWNPKNSCGAVYYAVQKWFYVLSLWITSWSMIIQMKAFEQIFPMVLARYCAERMSSFESVYLITVWLLQKSSRRGTVILVICYTESGS